MSFSNSSIKLYEQCPYKYKLQRIDGLQEPTGSAAERGKTIHAELESALIGLPIYSEITEYWESFINELKAMGAKPEVELGFTHDWEPCGFSQGEVWLRGVLDVLSLNNTTAYVADWKTGKERDYEDQVKLYAVMVMAAYPEIEEVKIEILYVDLKKKVSYGTIKRIDFESLRDWITSRILKIQADDIYAPKPSFNCKWCHFRKDNGGPCRW
jgi:CRISPR/Cas system-associated exonuclease Cas4 (RecB family)